MAIDFAGNEWWPRWWETEGRRNAELVQALRSRPLTADELQEVGTKGFYLLIQPMVPVNTSEKQAEFAALLSIQQSIQFAATRERIPHA